MKHYNYLGNEKLEKTPICATDFIFTLKGVGIKKPNMDFTNN